MKRLHVLVAVAVAALLIAGAVYADTRLDDRAFGMVEDGPARSGAWFCPHGGGPRDWEVFLQVANPGTSPSTVRVRTLGGDRADAPQVNDVEPESTERIVVPADGRGRASIVEWFGAWVAVGWLAHAGGGEGGLAAEPCAPVAGERWFVPDGTTDVPEGTGDTRSSDEYVVVMNPFARQAVVSLTLLSERKEPVQYSSLTDVVLRPFRSAAFSLNDVVLGERTVGTVVDASVGRVVAASLGVSSTGGIRAALGYLGAPSSTLTFPGGNDAGRTELVVMSTSQAERQTRVHLVGDILTGDGPQAFTGLAEATVPSGSARTFPATTSGPSSIRLSTTGARVASVRRTFGVASDQAAVTGATPGARWVVLPAVAGAPNRPGLVLANPGSSTTVVTLRYLAPGPTDEISVTVDPGVTVRVPDAFLAVAPDAAIVAEASAGTFVPAAASYSLGREGVATYAVALGIPLPEAG